MTEINLCNEVLQNAIGVHRSLEKIEPLNPMDAVAVQAIEELLKYRAIGTVEELKQAKAIYNEILLSEEKLDVPKECIAYEVGKLREKELREYQAIGTIEDFKALKEKNTPKKPNKSGVTDSNGVFHAINGINGVPYDLCPNCEINLCTDGMFGGNRGGMKYCKNCGQKIDWSE